MSPSLGGPKQSGSKLVLWIIGLVAGYKSEQGFSRDAGTGILSSGTTRTI